MIMPSPSPRPLHISPQTRWQHRSRLDNPRGIRHPGTGHGAGRRTGSTPVASNAGP